MGLVRVHAIVEAKERREHIVGRERRRALGEPRAPSGRRRGRRFGGVVIRVADEELQTVGFRVVKVGGSLELSAKYVVTPCRITIIYSVPFHDCRLYTSTH